MTYPPAADLFAEADARIERARQILSQVQPLADSPAERYLTRTRKIPAEAVAACVDLHYLPSPIDGRPAVDHAAVSLLRDAAGEISGLQLEHCDILGARAAAEPNKKTYSLREHGVRDGLFYAGGGSGDIAFLCEGFSCKPLAVAAAGIGPAYGGGGLHCLGHALPPQPVIVIVPDKAPPPDKWTADGKARLLDLHEAAYARVVDRALLAGRKVEVAAEPACTCCKDCDAFLRMHGAIRLQQLLGSKCRASSVAKAKSGALP